MACFLIEFGRSTQQRQNFVKKLVDVVGLYLNPPEHAIVLCADEKSQIQALGRTQPGLPIKKGRCGTVTHDYKRYGTTTLFAARDMLEGRVISECRPRRRHQEWIRFLDKIEAAHRTRRLRTESLQNPVEVSVPLFDWQRRVGCAS